MTASSLNEKIKVIEASEKNKLSVREIMLRFKCGKTQIYETLKNKDKIRDEWIKGNGQMKRKAKKTGDEEINEIVMEWFASAWTKNLTLSGSMLQSEALKVAKELGNRDSAKTCVEKTNCERKVHRFPSVICGEVKKE